MLDVELTKRALLEAVNFLVKGWCNGIARIKQPVSTSTVEAEYIVAESYCAQVLWIRNQLRNFGIVLEKIPIMCDNTSAISIVANLVITQEQSTYT